MADATAVVFCINFPLALIALLAVLALIDQEITLVFQRGNKAQSIHFFQKFLKISILMSIPLFLKIKVIVTEFMAHDFAKDFQT